MIDSNTPDVTREQSLPLQDDLTYAMQHGLRLSMGFNTPMQDDLWIMAALRTADTFSQANAWWVQLGVTHPAKKGLSLIEIKKKKMVSPHQAWYVGAWERSKQISKRLFFNTFFMDVPEERQQLSDFLEKSTLYARSRQIAHEANAKRIDWIHWLQALNEFYPEWGVMLGIPEKAFSLASLTASADLLQAKKPKRLFFYWSKEVFQFFLMFNILLIGMRQGIAEPRLIPSGSMEPTIQISDRVLVEKPSSWLHLPYHRGEVLVFVPPTVNIKNDAFSQYLRLTGLSGYLAPVNDTLNRIDIYDALPSADEVDMAFIKRLIALPGDSVQVVPNIGVFVNGVLLDEPYVEEPAWSSCTLNPPFVMTPICNKAIIIPEGHVFMMGDNRNNSHDSRFWGPLPMNRIIGRATFRFWPLNRMEPIGDEYPKINDERIEAHRAER